MTEFLNLVAKHYAARVDDGPLAFDKYLFVFPNRRSSLYFQHYLSELFEKPILAPECTTINELFDRFSDLKHVDRTEALFRLYRLYRKLSKNDEEFDKFVFWGDVLLGDFDEVDKYLVDARVLFANIKDIKDIDAYFSDYKKEIVDIIRQFWMNYNPRLSSGEVFGSTWSILYDLYSQYRKELLSEGLAYDGLMLRLIDETWPDKGAHYLDDETLFPYEKIVFVGLTAISKVERKLLLRFKNRGIAEFCWDYADPRANDPSSRASFFKFSNLEDFPNQFPDKELQETIVSDSKKKEIKVYGIPSGVGQTVQAGKVLKHWLDEGIIDRDSRLNSDEKNAFHTAVVLPDEKMLVPMLYAVPQEFSRFNVTMGYSLSETPVAGLINLLMQLQIEARKGTGEHSSYYYKSVLALLSHNYVTSVCDDLARSLRLRIVKEGQSLVPNSLLSGHPIFDLLFRRCKNSKEMVVYLKDFLLYLLRFTELETDDDENDSEVNELPISAIDREFIYCYAQAVDRIREMLEKFEFEIKIPTFFHLLQRLVKGAQVPFTGEPLSGLQVMGVLETRALDFDNLIILSMNEGVYPAKPSYNTFIPSTLRKAFGLTSQMHKDAVATYHFYRLLSRASRIVLIYDTRATGMQTGEQSRFLMQMRYLYPFAQLETFPVKYEVSSVEIQEFVVHKDEQVLQRLNQFRAGGQKQFSASSIKKYIECPLRFYLQFVLGYQEDDDIAEGVESRQFGTIFHNTMQSIYDRYKGVKLQSDVIKKIASDRKGIRAEVEREFKSVMKIDEIAGFNMLIVEVICEYVINTLKHDAKDPLFTYVHSEYEHVMDFKVNNQLTVRLKGIYDRLDIDHEGFLRIIDYKTGGYLVGQKNLKTQVQSIAGLFDPEVKNASEEAFQILMYCMMFSYASSQMLQELQLDAPGAYRGITPRLYFTRAFAMEDPETRISISVSENSGNASVADYSPYATEFEKEFRKVLEQIFDKDVPFTQCEDVKNCTYCPFITICKRN